MIFFIPAIFICLIVFALSSIYIFYQKISLEHFYKITIRAFSKKQFKLGSDRYFCSDAIIKAIKILRKKRQKTALIYLSSARINKAISVLKTERHEDIAISLLAHFNFRQALVEFEDLVKEQPTNMFILGEMAEIYYLINAYKKFQMVVERIDSNKSKPYTKAKKLYFETLLNMQDGDLLTASEAANKVINLFGNNMAYIEEAKTYLLSGIMYKAGGIFDPSQFMLDTALKIFDKYDDKIGIIEAYGNLAMLMSAQERFDEAEGYLEKAEIISKNSESYSYIINQKGLTLLLKKQPNEALQVFKSIKGKNNLKASAFNCEMISYIKYEQKNYLEALESAQRAEAIYEELENISAVLESQYLQALSHFELSELEKAELLARKIIDTAKKQPTSFHIANAYNLLGLIFINRGELSRAKSLFKESLGFEQRNNRISGIITDYYNIGLLEAKTGQAEQAATSLGNALEFATILGETALAETIKKRIKNLPQIK